MSESVDHPPIQKDDVLVEPQPKEYLKKFPELIANNPLENTSLVYSVPVMGEWKNGNLIRMLRGMLAQRIESNKSFEVELILNMGDSVGWLIDRDVDHLAKEDGQNRLLMIEKAENKNQAEALEKLREAEESLVFLKKIIELQLLTRNMRVEPNNQELRHKIERIYQSETDPLLRDVLEMAGQKSEQISVALIDATRTVFWGTEYGGVTLDSLRTLGADIALKRFEGSPDVVLGLYDADTIPGDNHSVLQVQKIFEKKPGLKYVFVGMSDLPAGHSKDLVADAPRENARRSWTYNKGYSHGSPQILFRLSAYRKLGEISSYHATGFHGDEDRDTAMRLIYHFGELQSGLLLDKALDYEPTSLTADRLDGSVDSSARKVNFEKNGVSVISEDIGYVFDFRDEVMKRVHKLPQEKKESILDEVSEARTYYLKVQERQQRLNRMVMGCFLSAVDRKLIAVRGDRLEVDYKNLMKLDGGIALSHYVKANHDLVRNIVSSPDDLVVIKYLIGGSSTPPDGSLSGFQEGIREYVGKVVLLDELTDNKLLSCTGVPKEVLGSGWKVEDLRGVESKTSFMHSAVAEILALGHIYKKHFEKEDFLESRDDDGGSFSDMWPKNPDDQKLNESFGKLDDRLNRISSEVNVEGNEVSTAKEKSVRWWNNLEIKSIPLFRLFKYLFGNNRY